MLLGYLFDQVSAPVVVLDMALGVFEEKGDSVHASALHLRFESYPRWLTLCCCVS